MHPQENSFGFPSGHTACAVLMFGSVALQASRHILPGHGRSLCAAVAALVVIMAFSRVYTG